MSSLADALVAVAPVAIAFCGTKSTIDDKVGRTCGFFRSFPEFILFSIASKI